MVVLPVKISPLLTQVGGCADPIPSLRLIWFSIIFHKLVIAPAPLILPGDFKKHYNLNLFCHQNIGRSYHNNTF